MPKVTAKSVYNNETPGKPKNANNFDNMPPSWRMPIHA